MSAPAPDRFPNIEVLPAGADVAGVILAFERAFRSGERPRLEDLVLEGTPSDLLRELVLSELELRLRAGENAGATEYLRRFPALAADAAFVTELLTTELESRGRRGERPQWSEYENVPPEHRAFVEAAFARIEASA